MNGKFRVFLAATLAMGVLCGCGAGNHVYLETNGTEEHSAQEEILPEEDDETAEEKLSCFVYVCGAVESPGVYELPEGSRIFEAVELAGGMTEEAAANVLNLAEPLTDGQMIRILTVEEAEKNPEADANEGATEDDGRLDINQADVAAFMGLPGIGQSKAESIVQYREANGPFSSVEEVMEVDGIKEGVFNKIKDRIKVN